MTSLIALLTITLQPAPITEPTIRKHEGDHYVMENPMKFPVIVTLNCGLAYDIAKVYVEASSLYEFAVQQPDGKAASCWVESWVRAKESSK